MSIGNEALLPELYEQAGHLAPARAQEATEILMQVMQRYAAGHVYSLPVEKAAALLHSVLYTLAAGDVAAPGAPAQQRFAAGQAAIRRGVQKARLLWAAAKAGRPAFATRALDDTLAGVGGFFQWYDVDFVAHEVPGSIDYQLAQDCFALEGVDFIQTYLRRLCLENEFCAAFAPAAGQALLARQAARYFMQARDLMDNLFTLLYGQALFCALAGAPPATLLPGEKQAAAATARLAAMAAPEREAAIQAAAAALPAALGLAQKPELLAYMQAGQAAWAARIQAAVANGSLHTLFLAEAPRAQKAAPGLRQPANLPDEVLREVIDTVARCPTPGQKAEYLLREPRSLEDMQEILNAGCLYGEDYTALFAAMGPQACGFLAAALQAAGAGSLAPPPSWAGALLAATGPPGPG